MIKISELQSKEVVNIGDGRRLGTVSDLDIDMDNGSVRSIIVPGSGRFFGLFSSGQDYVIPWTQIVKIGTDVILVELHTVTHYTGPSHSSGNGEASGGY